MAFVNTISFSHRFSDERPVGGYCSYQEINHTISNDDAMAVVRAFYQFMMACGYAPSNAVDAMTTIADEYGAAYCYDGKEMTK
jgi:hypothetical protein